jgi:radical SAM superfamily enzyme YgiQ (UPF0313 family)
MADVLLLTPRETVTGYSNLNNNQNVLINDAEYASLDPAMRLFYEKVRENLGLACIAAQLRGEGYSVRIVNLHGRAPDDDAIVRLVEEERPLLVGITIMYDLHIIDAVRLVECVRSAAPSAFLTIGGAFCTFNAALIAERIPQVDCVAYGEAELTVSALMERLTAARDWRDVPGLYYRDAGRVRTSGPPVLPDLAGLPWPARDVLVHHRNAGIPTPVASTYTSRGCHAKCTFCYAPRQPGVVGGPWRTRPAEDVLDEIEYLQRTFGTRFLWFNDDNFGGAFHAGYEHAMELAEGIIRRGLKISFHCEFRVDSGLIDRAALRTLRRAGMASALLGMETGSPGMMKRFKKGTTVDYNFAAARLFKEERIELDPGWIMIEPGTTFDELWENLQFIVASGIDETANPFFLINRAIALRGTEMYDKAPAGPAGDPRSAELGILKEARREYTVSDPRVEALWTAWSQVGTEVSDRKENTVPFLAQRIAESWRARSREDDGESGREIRALLSRLRAWRNDLSRLLVAFLNHGLLLGDRQVDDLPLRATREMRALVAAYDDEHLGRPFEDFVAEVERACGRRTVAGRP